MRMKNYDGIDIVDSVKSGILTSRRVMLRSRQRVPVLAVKTSRACECVHYIRNVICVYPYRSKCVYMYIIYPVTAFLFFFFFFTKPCLKNLQ